MFNQTNAQGEQAIVVYGIELTYFKYMCHL